MKRTRTCGSSCYTATEPKCDCICGGALHGKAGEANRKRIQAVTGGYLPKNAAQLLMLQAAIRDKKAILASAVKLIGGSR